MSVIVNCEHETGDVKDLPENKIYALNPSGKFGVRALLGAGTLYIDFDPNDIVDNLAKENKELQEKLNIAIDALETARRSLYGMSAFRSICDYITVALKRLK